MNKIKETLWKDYEAIDEMIDDFDITSEKYKELTEEKDRIRKELIELSKIEEEKNIKISQIKSEDNREKFRNIISIGTFVVTTSVSIYAISKTFKFDQVATVTSTLGRNILNGVIPKIFKK